ncbi:MAG: transporter substrate-binding domain-containing protein [Legionellaceae bacterium]|nr:transporter substrate-binding domain-containing protein [Legionellaceae bacterium]
MRIFITIICLMLIACNCSFADEETPIRIAVSHFSPPFVYQTASNELSGFDIDLMMHICKSKKLNCVFVPMQSKHILEAIASKSVDLGIGGIDISLNSYRYASLSIPYMNSEYRFLSTKDSNQASLTDSVLKNKKIGINNNGLAKKSFSKYAKQKHSKLVEYLDNDSLISALIDGSIDLALVRNETAVYWKNNSAGRIHTLGQPLHLGKGIGIPVSIHRPNLVTVINDAISEYKQTPEYKASYSMYFDPI